MNSISGGPAGLSVQVVTLDKHCVVTEASHPHVSLTFTLQLDPFTNVKPGKEYIKNKRDRERVEVIMWLCDASEFSTDELIVLIL